MKIFTRFARPVVAVFFLPLFYLNPLCGGEPTAAPSITPDATIQATIHRVVMAKDEDDKEAREAMNKLREMARLKPEALAPQLIYYSLHVKGEKEGLGSIGMMAYFARTWDSEMRKALIPLLEIKDDKVHREVAMWLWSVDERKAPKESNLTPYRETLLHKKESPPPHLVSYVFGYSPSQSLLLFGEIYSEKPLILHERPRSLLWSDHMIVTVKWRMRNYLLEDGDLEKAQKELDSLSRHEGWYARRYAVEVIRDMPKLGTPDIVNRLKKDTHPLVAESAKQIK